MAPLLRLTLRVIAIILLPAVSAMAGEGFLFSCEAPADTMVASAVHSVALTDTMAHRGPVLPDAGDADDPFGFALTLEEVPLIDPHVWADTALYNHIPRRYATLTDEDFRQVAQELGVETAAIKAVVDIEAGRARQGFWATGKPLINFDLSMYRRFAPLHGVSLSKARKSSPVIFRRPDSRRYGSWQKAQQARLDAACAIDSISALESTFWGMFQIGGFNWRKCGTQSVQEFVRLMSRSERDQLELFARFIRHGGMADAIRQKKWLQFALKYNGPRARARGYHTRLAAAYRRHKAAE